MIRSVPLVELRVRGYVLNGFQLCGALAFLTGVATTAWLTHVLDLSGPVMAMMVAAGLATLVVLTLGSRVLLGSEVLVNYHHLLSITAVAAMIAALSTSAVIAHLAAFALGLMVFQGSGRAGCLLVGCCHGRPHAWGICYDARFAERGFPLHLVGVVLFPIQAIEAAWAFVVAAAGTAALLDGRSAATVLAGVATAYAVGRFATAFWRGDSHEVRLAGFSEAQWTSLALLIILVPVTWSLAAGPRLAVTAVAVGTGVFALAYQVSRYRVPSAERDLLEPNHVLELAGALSIICDRDRIRERATIPIDLHLATTSEGVRLSRGTVWHPRRVSHHYTLSLQGGELSRGGAQRIASVIMGLRHRGRTALLCRGQMPGTFHLLVRCTALGFRESHVAIRLSAPN
jgi:hypothetical protein